MTLTKMNKKLTIGIAVAILGLVLFSLDRFAFGNIAKQIAVPSSDYQNYTFFATSTNQTYYSTTTTANSTSITPWWTSDGRKDNGYFVTAGAEEVTFFFTTTGTTTFSVDLSDDGTNWYDFNHLLANDASLTATTTVTLDGLTSTTAIYFMQEVPYAVRCSVTTVTAGTKSCRASAKW
jgi:hypothetical protein